MCLLLLLNLLLLFIEKRANNSFVEFEAYHEELSDGNDSVALILVYLDNVNYSFGHTKPNCIQVLASQMGRERDEEAEREKQQLCLN